MSLPFFLISLGLGAMLLVVLQRQRRVGRAAYIRTVVLPMGLFERLRDRHPGLSTKDLQLVAQALRQYFQTYLASGRQTVSMPSQVVDDLWHEFILHTKNYDAFCRKAFGRFLHHTPATALGRAGAGNAGLRRCFWFACKDENIDPRAPSRLPLLFAIDAKLQIPGGFHYVRDCASLRTEQPGTTAIYCAGDFSDASVDGGIEGFGGSGSDGGFGLADFGSGDGGGSGDSGGTGSCGGGGCGGGD